MRPIPGLDWFVSVEAEILLDRVNEPGAELLPLAVHRQVRDLVATPDGDMPAAAWLKSAALLL